MKVNLQLFAEGDGSEMSIAPEGEMQQQELPDSDAFEQMYYGELDDEQLEGEEDSDEQELEDEPEQQPWKNQQNADFAAQRRRQEEAQRMQSAIDAEYARMFAGQTNPYTGRPITTKAEYDLYQQQYQQEQLQQAGIDPGILDQMIQNHPAIHQAQAMMAQQQMAMQQQRMVAGLQAISQFDPDVKGFEDIIKNPNFAQIDAMYQRGYSLEDAYYLANKDKISQRKQAAAKQQVINQATGKSHMKATGSNGAGNDVSVPSDVMEMYKQMNPGATETQIKQHYARTHKE